MPIFPENNTRVITGGFTLGPTDIHVTINNTSNAAITITLPKLSDVFHYITPCYDDVFNAGITFIDYASNAYLYNITFVTQGTDTINGVSSVTLSTNGCSGKFKPISGGTWGFEQGSLCKKYVATLTQSGSNAPVAVVIENSLGGNITWAYSTNGTYIGTLAGAFTSNKTALAINSVQGETVAVYRTSANAILVQVFSGNIGTDNLLDTNTLEIIVYN